MSLAARLATIAACDAPMSIVLLLDGPMGWIAAAREAGDLSGREIVLHEAAKKLEELTTFAPAMSTRWAAQSQARRALTLVIEAVLSQD